MKVWLNDLKPGDKYWVCDWEGPREVMILGPNPDPSYAMKRWKLSDGTSEFVNHYVFTTKEETIDAFLPSLRKQLEMLETQQENIRKEIALCKAEIASYEKLVS